MSLSCSVLLLAMAMLILARELLGPNIHLRPFPSPNLKTDMHPDQRIYYIQFATSTSAHCVGHAIIVSICSNTSKKHGKTHLKINAPFSLLLVLDIPSFLTDGSNSNSSFFTFVLPFPLTSFRCSTDKYSILSSWCITWILNLHIVWKREYFIDRVTSSSKELVWRNLWWNFPKSYRES